MSSRLIVVLALAMATGPLRPAGVRSSVYFVPGLERWELSNGLVRAAYSLTESGRFSLDELSGAGATWSAPTNQTSSPIYVALDDLLYSGDTGFRKTQARVEDIGGGKRLVLDLTDLASTAAFHIQLEIFDGQSVIRQQISVQNLRARPSP